MLFCFSIVWQYTKSSDWNVVLTKTLYSHYFYFFIEHEITLYSYLFWPEVSYRHELLGLLSKMPFSVFRVFIYTMCEGILLIWPSKSFSQTVVKTVLVYMIIVIIADFFFQCFLYVSYKMFNCLCKWVPFQFFSFRFNLKRTQFCLKGIQIFNFLLYRQVLFKILLMLKII